MHARETRKPRLYRPLRTPRPALPRLWLLLAGWLLAGLAWASGPEEGLLWRDGDRWVATLAMDTAVDMQVRGLLAEVTVRQVYRNDSSQWREGRYLLPLPADAAVGGLVLRIGDRLVEGEVQEKAKAAATYEAAAAAGRRAGLVEQNRPNLFATSVANIGPGEEIEVEVRYWQPVHYRDGAFSLSLPLTLTPRYLPGRGADQAAPRDPHALPVAAAAHEAGSALPPSVTLQVEIEAGLPLQSVDSPTHAVSVSAEGRTTRVALARDVEASDRDFELRWTPVPSRAPRSAVFTDRVGGEDFAMVMLVPPTLPTAPLPRELVLVIDNSGSMMGTSMAQAILAADRALARLGPGDRFNVIRFDDTMEQLFPEAVAAQPAHVARARAFVRALRASGGTEMKPALEAALAGRAPAGFVRQVVLVTDAAVGNEDDLLQVIEGQRGDSRLFPVGIGSAPNGHFLRKAAEAGRGTQALVRDVNGVAGAMDALLQRLERPAMRDITLDWPGVAEAYPARVPDLYQGEAVQVVARVERLEGVVTVRGLDPQPWSRQVPLGGDAATPAPGLGRLWARGRIDELEDRLRRGAREDELRPAIVDVALRHGLASRFTSLVAVERTPARPAGEALGSTAVANAVPDGSLAFAQGSLGWARDLLLAALLALAAVLLSRGRA